MAVLATFLLSIVRSLYINNNIAKLVCSQPRLFGMYHAVTGFAQSSRKSSSFVFAPGSIAWRGTAWWHR